MFQNIPFEPVSKRAHHTLMALWPAKRNLETDTAQRTMTFWIPSHLRLTRSRDLTTTVAMLLPTLRRLSLFAVTA